MSLEITGRLIAKLDMQSGTSKTGNSWQKQEFVIETTDQYPQKICANLWGDKTDNLNHFNIGDLIKVSFDLSSREFNGKWYTDVRAWRIEAAAVPGAPMPPTGASAGVGTFNPNTLETSHTSYMQTAAAPATAPLPGNLSTPVETTFTDMGDGDDLPF